MVRTAEELLCFLAAVCSGAVATFAALCLLVAISALLICAFILAALVFAALGLIAAASVFTFCLLVVAA